MDWDGNVLIFIPWCFVQDVLVESGWKIIFSLFSCYKRPKLWGQGEKELRSTFENPTFFSYQASVSNFLPKFSPTCFWLRYTPKQWNTHFELRWVSWVHLLFCSYSILYLTRHIVCLSCLLLCSRVRNYAEDKILILTIVGSLCRHIPFLLFLRLWGYTESFFWSWNAVKNPEHL